MRAVRGSEAASWPGLVAISGLGAATSLSSMATAAAAARAGLSRFREMPQVLYVDEATKEDTPLVGAPIDGVTDGFEGVGRLSRMTGVALDDLLTTTSGFNLKQVNCFVALPPLDDDEAQRVGVNVAQALSIPIPRVSVHARGHQGTCRALCDAAQALLTGRCDHAIVGAIDSWLDAPLLEQQLDLHRLMTRNNPVGFVPGEAAVFLLLERVDSSHNSGAPIALLTHVREDTEDDNRAAGKPLTGAALSRLLLATSGQGGPGSLYLDLNGQESRAAEWGMALTRARARKDFEGWAQTLPAMSFGDTGIAAPILSVALATRAFIRGYAVGERAVVLASAEGPERLALVVEKQRPGPGKQGAKHG